MKVTAYQSPGLGKFNSRADERIYRMTMDGCDAEIGSCEELGWYGRLDGRILGLAKAGAIVRENSDGFVTVETYDDAEELARVWGEIESAYDDFYAENGEV